MSEIQLAHFAWGETPDRSRIHEVAIRDARIASMARETESPATTRPSVLERLGLSRVRLALAGGPVVTSDACCAA